MEIGHTADFYKKTNGKYSFVKKRENKEVRGFLNKMGQVNLEYNPILGGYHFYNNNFEKIAFITSNQLLEVIKENVEINPVQYQFVVQDKARIVLKKRG